MTYGVLFEKVESGELPPGLKGKTPKAKQPSRPQPSFAPANREVAYGTSGGTAALSRPAT